MILGISASRHLDSRIARWFLSFFLFLILPHSVSALPIPDLREARVAFSPCGEAFPRILGELRQARESVDVAMFDFSHKDIADALCFLAKQKGVTVRVLTGTWMDTPAKRPLLERLAQNGVAIHILPLPGEARMPLKCAIIDGETVIAGTANWTPTAFDHNFEDTLMIRSPALGRLYLDQMESLIAKAETFHAQSYDSQMANRISFPEIGRYEDSTLEDHLQAPRMRLVGDIRQAEVYFLPGREGIRRLLSQAQAATQQIDIGMYLVNDPEVVQALVSIAQEGKVKIRLLIDSGMLAGSLLTSVQELWDAGVDIHYYQKDREALHMKTAIIDGRYVWTGTANWTTGALELNVEDMLFFDSSEMARLYTAYLDEIQKFSKSFAPLAQGYTVAEVEVKTEYGSTGYLSGLPPTGPRTNFDNLLRDPIFPAFETQATVSYLPDEEYLPVLLDLIRHAHQSILIAMYVMSETKEEAEAQEQVHCELARAAARGVYVYLLLQTPTSVQDRLRESHSYWAEKLRARGIDVRLNLPNIHLHAKMVVVDLAKVLIGSHNWSEGALSGERVYESSALLVLPEQDIRFADYIMGRQTISDMRSKDLWEQEISLLCHVAMMSSSERADFLREREAPALP